MLVIAHVSVAFSKVPGTYFDDILIDRKHRFVYYSYQQTQGVVIERPLSHLRINFYDFIQELPMNSWMFGLQQKSTHILP